MALHLPTGPFKTCSGWEPIPRCEPSIYKAIWVNLHVLLCSLYVYLSHMDRAVPRTGRKEGNILFNDTLNTFYLRLYGIRHMVKDHSDNERGNLLPPHGLLFPISSKGYFICIIPETG